MPLAVNFDFMTSDKIIQNQDNEHRRTIKTSMYFERKENEIERERNSMNCCIWFMPYGFSSNRKCFMAKS